MRFLLDQSTDARLGAYLRTLGHNATRIGAEYYADLSVKIARLDYVLAHYATQLDQLLVVTPHRVRIRAQQS